VRRIILLTTACLVPLVIGGCKNDGRTLPPPAPDQNQSISSLSETTAPDGSSGTAGFDTTPPSIGSLTLTAPWRDGADIDARHTCDGANLSPALSWSQAPEGTVEIAITLSDLDVPGFVHWAIAGISASSVAIGEDTVPLGAYEAANSSATPGTPARARPQVRHTCTSSPCTTSARPPGWVTAPLGSTWWKRSRSSKLPAPR
jgi:hypothetical protein